MWCISKLLIFKEIKPMNVTKKVSALSVVVLLICTGYLWGHFDGSAGRAPGEGAIESAFALDSSIESPQDESSDRDLYFPNTEVLASDEMRVIACGTGMPTARPSQAAACFLVELGNGEKFLFDVGTGSAERIAALQIPYNHLDKVFLGHLHTDHFGDLASLFVGGALSGRQKPLRVWGPSGHAPEFGTKYAMDRLREMLTWDLGGRQGVVDYRGFHIEAYEFDYRQVNEIVYQENGVTIRSFPAIHAIDGPVSFTLEWNDLKFVYSSDTYPNKWFDEYARNADLVIHECFITVPQLVEKMRFRPQTALFVGTQIHTPPEGFGKVMSMIKPRMAVAYHFFNDFDTTPDITERIRSTYDGPLSLAKDYMVWNVTKESITTRMAVVGEEIWPPAATEPPMPPDRSLKIPNSELIIGGRLDIADILGPIYEEVNQKYGLDMKPN